MEQNRVTLQALRMPEVERRTGYKRAQIYFLESKKDFPQRIKLGGRASAWLAHEVDAWLAERIAKSRPQSVVTA